MEKSLVWDFCPKFFRRKGFNIHTAFMNLLLSPNVNMSKCVSGCERPRWRVMVRAVSVARVLPRVHPPMHRSELQLCSLSPGHWLGPNGTSSQVPVRSRERLRGRPLSPGVDQGLHWAHHSAEMPRSLHQTGRARWRRKVRLFQLQKETGGRGTHTFINSKRHELIDFIYFAVGFEETPDMEAASHPDHSPQAVPLPRQRTLDQVAQKRRLHLSGTRTKYF